MQRIEARRQQQFEHVFDDEQLDRPFQLDRIEFELDFELHFEFDVDQLDRFRLGFEHRHEFSLDNFVRICIDDVFVIRVVDFEHDQLE